MIAKSTSRKVFEFFNYTFLLAFCISILFPFINALAISMSARDPVIKMQVGLWPVGFNLYSYHKILINLQFWRTFFNTVFLTVINTSMVIVISLCAAYASTNKYFIGKKAALVFFLIPFFFSGGLIPTYLLVIGLGLRNDLLALILPGSVSIFYILVFRNIIARLPAELPESAEIDGAGQPTILFNIIVPLVIPTIAAFTVFSAVGEWNSWFGCLLYITDRKKWTLQFQLREILISATLHDEDITNNPFVDYLFHPDNIRMAALMCTVLPIVGVYPFMQKYFIHGVLVGAIKG